MSTRLVRGWTHLERQRGGSIGLRGPGETQLETDRRLLQKRVEQLQKRFDKVAVQRTQMRRARVRSEIPRVALVGYPNAGKSPLVNTHRNDVASGNRVSERVAPMCHGLNKKQITKTNQPTYYIKKTNK